MSQIWLRDFCLFSLKKNPRIGVFTKILNTMINTDILIVLILGL